MRGVLGRIAAVALAGSSVLAIGMTASAQEGEPAESTTSQPTTTVAQAGPTSTDDTTTTTTPTTTTPTTTTTTTTTTLPPPLVAELPSAPARVAPERGPQIQVTDTQPPPPPTIPPALVLPANSGEGRRVVYSKSRMRVWTVEADGTVSKTHAVSGRLTWNQPLPGTYSVFSRSAHTCNIKNPNICWRYMVRFTKGPGGDNIGFHEIPKDRRTGQPVQSESQLGQALSAGCVRQATPDALYIWNWAPVGTKVVVLA